MIDSGAKKATYNPNVDELSRLGNSKMTYVQYCIMVGNSSLLAELLMNSDSKNLFLLGRDAVSTSFSLTACLPELI